jgi:hypothetical protein
MRDALTDSLNSPAGRLAEVLIKRLAKREKDREMPDDMRARFDKLVNTEGGFGELARVRLAAEVSFLFERVPNWTKEIVPLFDWSSRDAPAMWSARKYSNYIGSPKVIALMKEPFLALFSRTDVREEDLKIFAEWLAAMMLAKQSGRANYPIAPAEARSSLRQAGVKSLPSVGHQFAMEMERAKPDEKISRWRDVVGPVFQSIWPLDVELQTAESTFKLVQILCASGKAFLEAADVIIPFIRPEDPRRHTGIFSISRADDVVYSSSPEKMLDLLAAVAGDAPTRSVLGLSKALDRVRAYAPNLADNRKFQKLVSLASTH